MTIEETEKALRTISELKSVAVAQKPYVSMFATLSQVPLQNVVEKHTSMCEGLDIAEKIIVDSLNNLQAEAELLEAK